MNFEELYVETCTSASLAAANGNAEALKKIVKSKKPTNGEDNKGWRALHHACYNGKIECIKILLGAHDVDINAQTFERETALYLTCCAELMPDLKVLIAKILLDAGADPNYDNKYMYINILNQAIISCNLSLIKLLISNGTDVNVQDDKFGSILNAAVETQNLEIVEFIASRYIHTVTVQTPDSADTSNSITFFHTAVLQRNEDILRILLRNPQCVKAIDIQDFQLRTCLYLACSVGYRKGIELLLNSVADPNIRSAGTDLPVMAFTEHVQEEDLNSSESLLGQLIRLTNKLEFKKPRQCSSSFFHMLADCDKQDLIFKYVLKHFPDLYSSMIVSQMDNKIRPQSTSFRSLIGQHNLSPLAFWCGLMSSRKNYKFFHKMVELDCHMRDTTRCRIPPLMMASGIEEVDPYVIKYLIRNGSDVMKTLGNATKGLSTAFLMGLFSPTNHAISTLLINSIPMDEICKGFNRHELTHDICTTESWIRKYYHDGTHSSTNLLRNVICASKFIPLWPFDLNMLEQRLRPTDQIKDQFNELLKKCEDISNQPKCLWHLACLEARKTIWIKGRGRGIIDTPMCTSIENFCKTRNLPPKIGQILRFENIILD